MRTAEAAGDRDWLARSAAPGRRAFQAAALGRCVAQAATVGGWAAIAVLVADRTWAAALVGLVLAGAARAGALAVSRRWARRGARQVADALRAALLRAVLPRGGGDTRPEEPGGIVGPLAGRPS